MIFQRLYLENVRSLKPTDLEELGKVNVFTGDNGAGKTSVLEGIHILSTGKSFRSGQNRDVLQLGQDHLTIGAKISSQALPDNPLLETHRIGLRYSPQTTLLKVDGERVKSISVLSTLAPVVAFDPVGSASLISESSARRRFMDWGCFQADPSYLESWRILSRVLSQRNSALRTRSSSDLVKLWDVPLSEACRLVSRRRAQYLDSVSVMFARLAKEIGIEDKFELRFRRGWPEEASLRDTLEKGFDVDRKRGFTYYGSHRDDAVLSMAGKPFSKLASRGQAKLVALLLKLSQLEVAKESVQSAPVLLLDDLGSELDERRLSQIWALVSQMDVQTFVTGTEAKKVFLDSSTQVFHVKQGKVS